VEDLSGWRHIAQERRRSENEDWFLRCSIRGQSPASRDRRYYGSHVVNLAGEGIRPGQGSTIGKQNALVQIAQYGDFECLDCGRAVTTLSSFRRHFAEAIRFSYRHFPLESIHPHATQAAEAAECARAQGSFWKMHDLLMANQNRLTLHCLYDYANYVGLELLRTLIGDIATSSLPNTREYSRANT